MAATAVGLAQRIIGTVANLKDGVVRDGFKSGQPPIERPSPRANPFGPIRLPSPPTARPSSAAPPRSRGPVTSSTTPKLGFPFRVRGVGTTRPLPSTVPLGTACSLLIRIASGFVSTESVARDRAVRVATRNFASVVAPTRLSDVEITAAIPQEDADSPMPRRRSAVPPPPTLAGAATPPRLPTRQRKQRVEQRDEQHDGAVALSPLVTPRHPVRPRCVRRSLACSRISAAMRSGL